MTVQTGKLGHAAPTVGELELLRAALCPPPEASAAWLRWRSVNEVYSASLRSHEILPAVSANLPTTVLGDDANRLAGLRRNTWVNNQLALDSLGNALDVLDAAGIHPVVVKGASLVDRVYRKPGTRRMADADIVVGPGLLDSALAELTANGWSAKGHWLHAVDMVGPSGRGVDLHRWVMFPRFSRVPERPWYARSVSAVVAGRPVRCLALADELVLSVVHGLFTSGPSTVRWPLDVSSIIEAASRGVPGSFWVSVTESARELGLGPVVAQGLAMCVEEFALDIPTSVLSDLQKPRLDPLVAVHWALHKAGGKPPMRVRHFIDMEREAGRRPSSARYARTRLEALREHGFRRVLRYRIGHLREASRRLIGGSRTIQG